MTTATFAEAFIEGWPTRQEFLDRLRKTRFRFGTGEVYGDSGSPGKVCRCALGVLYEMHPMLEVRVEDREVRVEDHDGNYGNRVAGDYVVSNAPEDVSLRFATGVYGSCPGVDSPRGLMPKWGSYVDIYEANDSSKSFNEVADRLEALWSDA